MPSQKDYVAIAAILKDHNKYGSCTYHWRLCNQLGNYFESDNPAFSWDKFMDACGYGVEEDVRQS